MEVRFLILVFITCNLAQILRDTPLRYLGYANECGEVCVDLILDSFIDAMF